MITWQEAQKIVAAHARPLETERRQLAEASDYCLAEEIRADRDFPPTDRSAMDGFAVRAADTASAPCFLPLLGESRAGRPYQGRPVADGCVRIMTGAVVPDGADTVVRQEDCLENDGLLRISATPKIGANIRNRGEEAVAGEKLLPCFAKLNAAAIGLSASIGRTRLKVFRRPRVAIVCTGSELAVGGGASICPELLRDSNGPGLAAVIKSEFAMDVSPIVVEDDQGVLKETLHQALANNDAVIVTGGMSVGKYDLVPGIVQNLGAAIAFHGVAIKPGKPQLYATLKNKHIFGLPGNPLGALAGMYLLVLPALRAMAGTPLGLCSGICRLPLAHGGKGRRDRAELCLARLVSEPAGQVLKIIPAKGSADLASAVDADCFVIIEPNTQLANHETVDFIPWKT